MPVFRPEVPRMEPRAHQRPRPSPNLSRSRPHGPDEPPGTATDSSPATRIEICAGANAEPVSVGNAVVRPGPRAGHRLSIEMSAREPYAQPRERAIAAVANHASRVEPADACFRDCIGAAWQPLTVAPMLRPRRAMCVRRRLLPVIRVKVGKHWIARPRLMLCLWKQRCCTSSPTSGCTDSRTAPAMQRPRARGRNECSSSFPIMSPTSTSAAASIDQSASLRATPASCRGSASACMQTNGG